MGDLDLDTRVTPHGDGEHYLATLSRDWEIWGPNGGYVASIALRAAAARSRFKRPASFAAHYLAVAAFETVQLEVRVLRAAKRAESLRVSMTQGDKAIMEALVWMVDDLPGLVHDETRAPDVPPRSQLKSFAELIGGPPPFRFWENLERHPIDVQTEWPPKGPLPALQRDYMRFTPRATFDDPVVDAARSLLLIDTMQWPAGSLPHAYRQSGYLAPTIDLAVNFHRSMPAADWLLCVAEAPIAGDGLVGGRAAVWSEDRKLLASGAGHMLCLPVRPGTLGAA